MGWPISGLHCQLTPETIFRVELTENYDNNYPLFSIIGLANGVGIGG
jgi:hypothetical protein